jgi:hypothetical protein
MKLHEDQFDLIWKRVTNHYPLTCPEIERLRTGIQILIGIIKWAEAIGPRPDAEPDPFTERFSFERVSDADQTYLRGQPVPLTIQIPIVIEQ